MLILSVVALQNLYLICSYVFHNILICISLFSIIKAEPRSVVAFFGRGAAYARKELRVNFLEDFNPDACLFILYFVSVFVLISSMYTIKKLPSPCIDHQLRMH